MTLKIPTKTGTLERPSGDQSADERTVQRPADGQRTAVVPRSEGQRLLLAVSGSLAQIAIAVGTSKQRVHDWRSGGKAPAPVLREKLRAAYGIPPASWDMKPGDQVDSASATSSRTRSRSHTAASDVPSAGEDLEGLVAFLRGELARPDIVASERLKITHSMTRALALRHRFEVEQALLEDRIIREHPAWQRLQTALLRALQDHPAAARAVAEALADAGFDR